MAGRSATPSKPIKPYIFYGHRRPSNNRPSVYGGIFTNRQSINSNKPTPRLNKPTNFDLQKWGPDSPESLTAPPTKDPSQKFFCLAQTLSPIARYIVDSFRKHKHWGPPIVSDLNKLRRVTPKLVAEVIKVPDTNPRLLSKFFHWAGKQKGYKHDFACYNAFAYYLNKSNQFRAADQVPELMHMQGKPPSEKQFEILIRMHSDMNRGLRVYYVYEKIKKFGLKPRVFLYNRVMDSLVKTGHLDLAMSVYDDFREDGLAEESITFMILIKGLCRAGRMDEVFQLLSRMRGNLCRPDVFAYTAMVRVLISEGNLDGCLRVWADMRRDNIEPDIMAYTTLVTGLCKGNRVDKGYKLFQEMKEKGHLIDRAIYGSLIEAFVRDGQIGVACDLLKDLIDSGYRADLSIYNSLIDGLCSASRVEMAYKLFQVTVEEDLQPDFRTVNPMLVSYAELNRMDKFHKLLMRMHGLGFKVIDDLSKFFSFMVGKKDRIVAAIEVFKFLKAKNYCSVPIYNILMEALCENGDANRALEFFHEMNDSNLKPDTSTYSIATACFSKVGNVQEACHMYNKIKELSSVPSLVAYVSLVKGLCRIGEIDAAMMLVRDCLANVTSAPVEFKYSLTIIHVGKSSDAQKVIVVIDEMLQQGCAPCEVIYSAIIYGMCKYGKIEDVRAVLSNMRDRKFLSESDFIFYDEMIIEHMKKKTADLVVSGLKFFGLESKLKSKGCTLIQS